MPGSSGVNVEGSCEALCRTLVSQKGLQRETADISQSVLYTSLMGLLLVTDNEVTINILNQPLRCYLFFSSCDFNWIFKA